jgi:hypothetical protein
MSLYPERSPGRNHPEGNVIARPWVDPVPLQFTGIAIKPDGLPALVELVWLVHVQAKPQFRVSMSQTARQLALASPDLKTTIVDCALAGLISAAEAEELIALYGLTRV